MAKPWKMMLTSKRGRVLLLASTSLTFLLKNSLKLQMISKQIESNYRANRVTSLTSISIHQSRFLKWSPVKGRRGDRTRTVSRDFPRMRSVVASAIGSVTINLHVSTTKFGLIGTIEMTWYSKISSRMLSNRTGTALARLDNNRTDFTSKPAKIHSLNGAKHAKRRDGIFLKNQDRAFKHHQYHHLFFCDRFFLV